MSDGAGLLLAPSTTSELAPPPPPCELVPPAPPLPKPLLDCTQQKCSSVVSIEKNGILPRNKMVFSTSSCNKSRYPGSRSSLPNLCNRAEVLFELTKCLEENNLERISQLFESGAVTVNSKLPYGVPILLKAVRSKSSLVIDFLLTEGADPTSSIEYLLEILDMRTSTNRFSYCHESFLDEEWCTDYLLKMFSILDNDSLNEISKQKTILLQAVHLSKLCVFEYLLFQRNCSMYRNEFQILSALLERNDEPNDTTLKILKNVLLLSMSSLNLGGNDGFQLLCKSLVSNKKDFFSLLIKKGANPFLRTEDGNTLMHFLISDISIHHVNSWEDNSNVAKTIVLLHDIGLDVNLPNNFGEKPLENAPLNILLILVIIGQHVSESKLFELDHSYGIGFSLYLKRFKFCGFSSLKHLCRRKIRNTLYLKDDLYTDENISFLPLPNPLKLYLDIISYSEHIVESFTQLDYD